MSKKLLDKPKRNVWDRPPWPKVGDKTEDSIYVAVGRALSHWEKFDAALGGLFGAFVGIDHGPAERAYAAVRTFEGRLEMLRAASGAFFNKYPNEYFQKRMVELMRLAANFGPRRNDITHAIVDLFREEGQRDPIIERRGYGLFPTEASYKARDLERTPSYCYTSRELEYLALQFNDLIVPAAELCGLIYRAQYNGLRKMLSERGKKPT